MLNTAITEEMIEAAARASYYRVHAEPYAAVKFEDLPTHFQEGWLASARVGLEAARALSAALLAASAEADALAGSVSAGTEKTP
jgi:hypothetical protein